MLGGVRSAQPATLGAVQKGTGGCKIKGNIGNSGEVYHVPGSRSYANTKIDEAKGERWFSSEAEARVAGWRAPRNRCSAPVHRGLLPTHSRHRRSRAGVLFTAHCPSLIDWMPSIHRVPRSRLLGATFTPRRCGAAARPPGGTTGRNDVWWSCTCRAGAVSRCGLSRCNVRPGRFEQRGGWIP